MSGSDVSYTAVSQRLLQNSRIDVIDDAWLTDTLSDDEIEVPKDIYMNEDEDDEADNGILGEDSWNDPGLDRFMNEQTTNFPTSISMPSQPSIQTATAGPQTTS